ncbi:MAG: hypothetical protein AAF745_06450 [Planctomycetota bacterium]
MSAPITASQLYADLEFHLSGGDLDGSLAVLDEICRQFESHGGAWELRGHLEARAGRPNLSVRYFERASELCELEAWSSRTLAIQYVAIGRDEVAAEILHVLGLSGRLESPLLRRVSQDLVTLDRLELAVDIVWHAIQINGGDAALWHELAAIQSLLGESPDVCLQAVERAIELAPSSTEFRVSAATMMIRMDDVQAAYELVRDVVGPDDGPASVDLDCPCGLWRLICIFESFNDFARMSVCYDRLSLLESKQTFW